MGTAATVNRVTPLPQAPAVPEPVEPKALGESRARLNEINESLRLASDSLKRVVPIGKQRLTVDEAKKIYERLDEGPLKSYLREIDAADNKGEKLRQAVSDFLSPQRGDTGRAGTLDAYCGFLKSLTDLQVERAETTERLKACTPGDAGAVQLRGQLVRLDETERKLFATVPELRTLRAGTPGVTDRAAHILTEAVSSRERYEHGLVRKHQTLLSTNRLDAYASSADARSRGLSADEARRWRMQLPETYEESVVSSLRNRQLDEQARQARVQKAMADAAEMQRIAPLEPGNVNYRPQSFGPGLTQAGLSAAATAAYEASHATPPSGAFTPKDVRALASIGMLDSLPSSQIEIPAQVAGVETPLTRANGDHLARALDNMGIARPGLSHEARKDLQINAGKLIFDAAAKKSVVDSRLTELSATYLREHHTRARELFTSFSTSGALDTRGLDARELYLTLAAAEASGLTKLQPPFGAQLLNAYMAAYRGGSGGASGGATTATVAATRVPASAGRRPAKPEEVERLSINGTDVEIRASREPQLSAALREARLSGLRVSATADNTRTTYVLSDASGNSLGSMTTASMMVNRDEKVASFINSNLNTTIPGLEGKPIWKSDQPALYRELTRLRSSGATVTYSAMTSEKGTTWRFTVTQSSGSAAPVEIDSSAGAEWVNQLAAGLAKL